MLAKSLQRRNQRFNKLSPEKKRVKIAQDVLKQLNAGVYKPQKGVYTIHNAISFKMGDDLQKVYTDKLVSCRVCAVGSLFVSSVLQGNSCQADFGANHYTVPSVIERDFLLNYFDYKQIDDIEHRFENWDNFYRYPGGAHPSAAKAAKERMIDIMNNIIRNNGTFNKKEK